MGVIASQITSLTIVYSTVYSDADQRKHQSAVSLAFVSGIHRSPVNSPHKWSVTRKMVPFGDVIMIYCMFTHHLCLRCVTWCIFVSSHARTSRFEVRFTLRNECSYRARCALNGHESFETPGIRGSQVMIFELCMYKNVKFLLQETCGVTGYANICSKTSYLMTTKTWK